MNYFFWAYMKSRSLHQTAIFDDGRKRHYRRVTPPDVEIDKSSMNSSESYLRRIIATRHLGIYMILGHFISQLRKYYYDAQSSRVLPIYGQEHANASHASIGAAYFLLAIRRRPMPGTVDIDFSVESAREVKLAPTGGSPRPRIQLAGSRHSHFPRLEVRLHFVTARLHTIPRRIGMPGISLMQRVIFSSLS